MGLGFTPASASFAPDLLCDLPTPPKLDHLIVREQASIHLANPNTVGLLEWETDGRVLTEAVQCFMIDVLVLLVGHKIVTPANRIIVPVQDLNWELCQDAWKLIQSLAETHRTQRQNHYAENRQRHHLRP